MSRITDRIARAAGVPERWGSQSIRRFRVRYWPGISSG
jgi:hypothetical protein